MFRASICQSSGVLGFIRCILLHMMFSKLVPLVIFMYDARTHIQHLCDMYSHKITVDTKPLSPSVT